MGLYRTFQNSSTFSDLPDICISICISALKHQEKLVLHVGMLLLFAFRHLLNKIAAKTF